MSRSPATYQATHPQAHVILLFGHARGVAEQLLDPLGNSDPNGLPNFTVADAGVPAYATVDQGGFYNYALFHVLPNGDRAVRRTAGADQHRRHGARVQPGRRLDGAAVRDRYHADRRRPVPAPGADRRSGIARVVQQRPEGS